ncbi:hypothetical protein SAMN02910415_01830 [Basfia succiniciproducens]|nr:hypothetical protein SAMN02910415_01830 [Basfia succiniciproducens]
MNNKNQDEWDKFYSWYKEHITIILYRTVMFICLIAVLIEVFSAH